jgi:phospholipid transport system substrate-binding protein
MNIENMTYRPDRIARWLLLLLLLSAWPLQALAVGADQFIRSHTEKVLAKVLSNKATLKANPERLYSLIRSSVLPHLDFQSMSRSVLGKHWRKASRADRNAFVSEFRQLLVRTYGTALLNYSGQSIKYKPAKLTNGGKYAIVRTRVPRSGGSPVSIDYRLRSRGSSWKVVDLKVGGVSLISNYRTSFSRKASTIGVAGLVKELKAKNAG